MAPSLLSPFSAPVGVATYNGGGGPSRREFVAQIRAAVDAGGGLASLQETGDRDFELDVVDDDPFLDVVVSGKRGVEGAAHAGKIAIGYDTRRYLFERGEIVQVNEARFVGKPGAGASTTAPDRYVLVAWFRDLVTGRRVILIAGHLVPSVAVLLHGEPVRDEISEASVAVIVKLVRRLRRRHPFAVIAFAGDLNFPPDHDNARPLREDAGLVEVGGELHGYERVNKIRPTHGTRHIDHVWTRLRRFVRIVSDRVVPANPKDHDTYAVTLDVRFALLWHRNPRRVTLPGVPVSRR